MTAQLIPIDAEPPGKGIVELLEEALAKARAGELSSAAVVMIYRDGAQGHLWSFAPSIGLLAGAVNRLSYKLNQELDG